MLMTSSQVCPGPRGTVRAAGALALLSAVLLSGGCRNEQAARPSGSPAEPVEVQVSPVETRPWDEVLTVLGALESVDQAALSVKNTGRLRELRVDVGSPVRAGDVLAQVEPRDYELQMQQSAALLAQARARLGLPLEGNDDAVEVEKLSTVRQARALLEEAQAGLERAKRLQAENISSQAEFERATAEYQVQFNRYTDALQDARERQAILAQRRAEYDIARQQVADTSLRAPFDGMVQARLANVGEFLAAGTPVLTVVQVDPLRLRLDVPERRSLAVQMGQTLHVAFEGDSQVYTGKVARVSPALDPRTRLLRVEGELKNPGHLRPGAFARASIVISEGTPGLSIPQDSVVTFAGTEKVFLVLTNTAIERPVVLGRRNGPWVEVLQGLQAGDPVVRSPSGIAPGSPVRTKSAPKPGAAS